MLNIVLGEGQMPTKELHAALQDLWNRDKDDSFWFIVQAKAEPTPTDKALVKWFDDHDIWYSIVTDGDFDDKVYASAQEKHQAKRLAPKIVELMNATKAGSEDADPEDSQILALFASDDFSAEEDRWLNDCGKAAQQAGFPTLALNDGLVEMDMLDDETEAEAEPAPAPAGRSKRGGLKAVPDPEPEVEADDNIYTREQLEEMDLDALKKIAAGKGIELPARTRMGTYIKAILGEAEEEGPGEVEVTPPESVTQDTEGTTIGTVSVSASAAFAPAMIIVIYDGSVTSRAISSEQAMELMARRW